MRQQIMYTCFCWHLVSVLVLRYIRFCCVLCITSGTTKYTHFKKCVILMMHFLTFLLFSPLKNIWTRKFLEYQTCPSKGQSIQGIFLIYNWFYTIFIFFKWSLLLQSYYHPTCYLVQKSEHNCKGTHTQRCLMKCAWMHEIINT